MTGKQLIQLMERHGLTISDLMEKTGYSRQSVWRFRRTDEELPPGATARIQLALRSQQEAS